MSYTPNSALSQSAAPATTAETTLVTADANFRNDIDCLVISQSAAGTVTIRNVTGGAAILVIVFAAAGTVVVPLPVPAQGGGLNQNWTVQNSAGTTNATAFFHKGA